VRFLFVHQNFPGQFLHILHHLVADGRHEIVFVCQPNANEIDGVRKITYACAGLDSQDTHPIARDLDNAAKRADPVAGVCANLKQLGFTPDIIIGHHGWGEMLQLPGIWPGVPLLGYLEFYYRTTASDVGFDPEFPVDPLDYTRIRAKNAINHLALALEATNQCPTEWQRSTYPLWAQPNIHLLWEGVDLNVCRPDEGRRRPLTVGNLVVRPSDKLITYVARNLEPYRGFHSLMRALPRIMNARSDVKAVVVGGDGVSYGSQPQGADCWRTALLKEVGDQLDLTRIAFVGRIDYGLFTKLLQRSDAHLYLTYPFVASWSLREAIAIGCPIIGSDTPPVREFIVSGETGLLKSFFDYPGLADAVLQVLEDEGLAQRLRTNARRYAVESLDLRLYLASYEALIRRLTGDDGLATTRSASKA
jgi:glycosyltransferase involved in cell wall biosynthesis